MSEPPPSMIARRTHLLVWFLPLVLAGCSAPPPYQTYSPGTVVPLTLGPNNLTIYNANTALPENDMSQADAPAAFAIAPTAAAPNGIATPDTTDNSAIAICYSRLWNTTQSVKSAATQACGGRTARLVRQGTNLDACTVLTPTQAVYACTAGP